MGNWQIILVFLVALLGASSCNKMEMRGFVTSYENANVRFEQSLIWNNEQGYSTIELSKNAYEINVMGDSHVGGVENLDAFFEASQNDNVAAVAMIGDITTGHETDYNVLAEHLPNIDSLPYFAVLETMIFTLMVGSIFIPFLDHLPIISWLKHQIIQTSSFV